MDFFPRPPVADPRRIPQIPMGHIDRYPAKENKVQL